MSAWLDAVIERVILVGFMCSGKSVVGRLLAEQLGWEFVDFDETIERIQNKRIADIFRDHGEGFFRSLEAEVTEQVVERRNVVLAPGGGWVARLDLVERLRPHSLMVWLRVQPDTVYRRHRRQADVVRPLLCTEEPERTIRTMLERRTPLYEGADVALHTDDREPVDIAAEIAKMLVL